MDIFADMRGLNVYSMMFRLLLAMMFGGMIGMERGRKRRAAGFRTYMLVCIGAALTMILGQYELMMLKNVWGDVGQQTDVSRFGAQVINGIGFLGAGTVIVTDKHQVKGLTTAAGLWASACIGLAVGAGFYECVIPGLVLVFICVRILPGIEKNLLKKARNMNVYMELESTEHLGSIIASVKNMDAQICSIELDRNGGYLDNVVNAALSIRMKKNREHSLVLAEISANENIRKIEEI